MQKQGAYFVPVSVFYYMMSEDKKIISIDAMGGDKGPNAVMGGINQFLYQNGEEDVFFRLFGDEKKRTFSKIKWYDAWWRL